MGEWDSYIDAVCEVDQFGTLPPLNKSPEYDADAETWDLYFEYSDPMTGGNDMVGLPFLEQADAVATQQRILSNRLEAQKEHEQQKAKKALDKQA
jgi:hypothetical protein